MKNRRLLSLLLCSMVCMCAGAQDKLFATAIKNGKSSNGMYVLTDAKGKPMKYDKLFEYAKSQNYIVGSVKGADGKMDCISSMEFLPQDQYVDYLYDRIHGDSHELSDLSNKGAAYCYLPDAESKNSLWRCDDVMWSGTVSNGLINGSGSGFCQIKNMAVVYFKGYFTDGLPGENTIFRWYAIKQPAQFLEKNVNAYTTPANVGEHSQQQLSIIDANLGKLLKFVEPFPSVRSGEVTYETRASGIAIENVTCSPSGVVVDFVITPNSSMDVWLDRKSYIEAQGQQLMLTRCKGIQTNPYQTTYMPSGMKSRMHLTFPALPDGTEQFDVILPGNLGWKFYNIRFK